MRKILYILCCALLSASLCAGCTTVKNEIVHTQPPTATPEPTPIPTFIIPTPSPTLFPMEPVTPSPTPPAADALRTPAQPGATPEPMPASLDAFFDDAAFIGDSVSLKLRNYAMNKQVLGKALFLTVGSFSVNHAVTYDFNVSYQGADAKVEDALAQAGCNKVFIMLGLNDIALHGIDKTIANWGTMIGNIRAQSPNIKIYIQSATPVYASGQKGSFTNSNFDQYNVKLKEFAQANNCTYIDLASYLKVDDGSLAAKYCSDEYVHLTDSACEVWVNLLRSYAQ